FRNQMTATLHPIDSDTPTDAAPKLVDLKLSPIQEQLLRGIVENGGACAYNQLPRIAYGLRKQDLPNADRSRIAVSLRHLETRGLIALRRRWGTLGYGQPELVELTDLGRAYITEFGLN
ncbi:MAG TPA: hypothetical protein VFN74_01650, partial [Chloroflexota bacterium]|nr:hypothetical protein [Chloroflexota bacterium]